MICPLCKTGVPRKILIPVRDAETMEFKWLRLSEEQYKKTVIQARDDALCGKLNKGSED